MAFKLVTFAALLAVARAGILSSAGHLGAAGYLGGAGHLGAAGHLGYAAAPLLSHGSHGAISTYSTLQHHTPAVHTYAAAAPIAHAALPVAHAAPAAVAYAAPIAKAVIAEPSAPAHYDFGYAVSDPLTGDSKTQQESRRGDVVHGSYSLLESDGTKRTVEYSADDHNGFNAVVHKEPAVHAAPVIAKVAAPAVVAAPVAHAAYAAPLAHAAIAAPVAHSVYGGSIAHGYAAPALSHGYAAPALAHGYAAAPGLSHAITAHAPALSYASHQAPAW